jgi:hypothetical protein
LLGKDLGENGVDFAGHVGSVAADIEVSLLLQQLVDLCCSLPQSVLHIHLLGSLSGEGSDDLELVAQNFLGFLHSS